MVLGLIEGWHSMPGKRPLRLQVEGAPPAIVDLVEQVGKNVPALFAFSARDVNGDGRIAAGVYPVTGAPDSNTILSALWIFPASTEPSEEEILSGGADKLAAAVADVDTVQVENSLELLFPPTEGRAEVLLTVCRGRRARTLRDPFKVKEAAALRDKAVSFWKNANLPFDRIVIPDKAAQALLDSCIRNLYQAREYRGDVPVFQVGPTCYRGTWAADGPFILEAVTYLGRAPEARASMLMQVDHDDGPGGIAFSKKSGLRLWMIYRHCLLTGDRAFLESMWPRIVREVNQIRAYRALTRTDPFQANWGLMPIGFGDGGLGGLHREYTNVYWTLSGLRAACEAAERLGKPEASDWKEVFREYWETFDRARRRDALKDRFGNLYVPVVMKGERPQAPQRGAWAFLQAIFPGRIFKPTDPYMAGTLAMLDSNVREGLIYGTGWLADGIWNYAGSFYAHAHLYLGHARKAAATFYAFANHACPLLCWREEQNCKGEPYKECGDMPHNWASAEYIRLVRHMVMLERGKELHLLPALPRRWTSPGMKTKLVWVPTSFGPVDLLLEMSADGRSARFRVRFKHNLEKQGATFLPLEKVVVHLENFSQKVKRFESKAPIDPRIPSDFDLKLEFDR